MGFAKEEKGKVTGTMTMESRIVWGIVVQAMAQRLETYCITGRQSKK
jgi:hypothetical protein